MMMEPFFKLFKTYCEEDDEIQNSQETVSAVGELLWEDEE